MRKKFTTLLKFSKKSLVKIKHLNNKNFYRGYSFPEAVKKLVEFPIRHGVGATLSRAKREIIRVSGRSNIKHRFPNGLVSGVDANAIAPWFRENARQVSIVIPSYNDYDLLEQCVKSIHETCNRGSFYDIIIVDDYCQEDNREKLRTLADSQTRIIFREKNGGFAKAVNTGLREVPAHNDAIILNSDIVAKPNWLAALQYAAYTYAENVGIVGPKLLYPDGRIQSAGSYRNTEDTEWFDHYYRFQDADYGPANVPYYCMAITGACQYIKREFMDAVGILDEDFEFAFEDADLCLRGWEKGYSTLYFPAATLIHHESATRAKNKKISEKERQAVVYFWQKWGSWFDERNVNNDKGQIRVIYVLQTLGWSGGIKIAVEHANRLAELGFAPEIWSLDNKSVWDIKVPTRSFKNYGQLVNALKDEEAIKVATWWETAYPVWQASLLKGIAVNFIQEMETWFYPDDTDAQRVVIASYRKEFKNITTSSYNLDEIMSLGLKATLVPCGYDNKTYYRDTKVKRKDNVLLAVGRTFFQKNFMFSFNAWRRLGETRPDFWLFGSEPDMKTLDEKITYHYKPTDAQVNKLYNTTTAFVQTSRHEGFCLPLLEAMAAGAPVICTDAHGNRDFCIDGKTCLMVEHDNEEQLARAMERVFGDKSLREKLSRNGLKEAEKYTWDVVIRQMADFYSAVAKPASIAQKVKDKYGS